MEITLEPARVVLQGVPRVHFYEGGPRCPEDIPFQSVMRAVLEYLGEDIGCDHCHPAGRKWNLRCSYAYFLGVTGQGAQVTWSGWDDYSFNLDFLPGGAKSCFQAAFDAVGYSCEIFDRSAGEGVYRQKIIESIRDRQMPAIATGIVGPPEACLITGYDESGDVLTGWSFFQNEAEFAAGLEFESTGPDGKGYFRKRGWFDSAGDLIVIGEHGEMPDQGKVFERALARTVEVMRTPEITVKGLSARTGVQAFTAWAETIQRDEDFAGKDDAALHKMYQAHDFTVGNLAEARWYGGLWMANTFSRTPNFKRSADLLEAAGCFTKEHELMWRAWDLCGGLGNPEGWRKFVDPTTRKALAAVILDAQEADAKALYHIERALSKN